MTFWGWLNAIGPGWPGQRGWYALGLFLQTALILWMIATVPALRTDEFFKSISTAIVVTGWIGFAVGLRDPARDREQIGDAIAGINAAVDRLPNPKKDS